VELISGIAKEWILSFDDMLYLAELPWEVCLETVLQLCQVQQIGRFVEDWASV